MYIGNIHLLWSYLNLSTSSRGLDITTRGEYFQYTQFKMCILSQYIGFLLLKIWAQIFRISTILEILVTLALHRGYPSDYTST